MFFNFLSYADFPYKSILNDSIVEIPVCKSIFDEKRINIVDVDFGGSVYIKQHGKWEEEQLDNLTKIHAKELIEKYEIWAKIIHNEDYLLDRVDELRNGIPPDQPCLFYDESPSYYVYKKRATDTTWILIQQTKNEKIVQNLIGI